MKKHGIDGQGRKEYYRNKGPMKRRNHAILLTAVVGLMLTTTACAGKDTAEPEITLVKDSETQTYNTATVGYGDVTCKATVDCTYTATKEEQLSFAQDGYLVDQVNVKKGDYVTKGQLLVSLEVEDLENEIGEQQYAVDSLALKLEQTRELQDFDLKSAETLASYKEMTSEDRKNLQKQQENIRKQYTDTLEDLEDQLSIQQDRLDASRQKLSQGRIYAGISGEVTYVKSDLEDAYSKKDEVVVTISDQDSSVFYSDDMEYADFFAEGQTVELSYRELGEEFTCQVEPVKMDQWEADGKMYFKTVGTEFIESGKTGAITLTLETREHVLCVPTDAVHESSNGSFVYLMKDGMPQMRYVTLGLAGDTNVEITKGLEQGEIIALTK